MTRTRTADAEDVFSTPLDVRWDRETGKWKLISPLVWKGSDGDAVIVPAGEETDFASVPRLLQNIMPATGKWTRAAVVHDMLCRLLAVFWLAWHKYDEEADRWINEWIQRHEQGFSDLPAWPFPTHPDLPRFSAVDTDAVFEKIMKEDGVGPIMRRIGWVGVRWGAAANPARRKGWASTLPRLAGLSTAFLAVVLAVLVLVAWIVPW